MAEPSFDLRESEYNLCELARVSEAVRAATGTPLVNMKLIEDLCRMRHVAIHGTPDQKAAYDTSLPPLPPGCSEAIIDIFNKSEQRIRYVYEGDEDAVAERFLEDVRRLDTDEKLGLGCSVDAAE